MWSLNVVRRPPDTVRLVASDGGREFYVEMLDGMTAKQTIKALRMLANGVEKATVGSTAAERRAEATKDLLAKAFGDDIDAMASYVMGAR